MNYNDNTHVYHCVNKHCAHYHVEFTSCSPYQSRKLYGRPIVCPKCGQIVQFLRFVKGNV